MTTQTKPKLSASEVRALLVRAVEEKGADHVGDRACVYTRDGRPSCIVGHVFAYVLGRPYDGPEGGFGTLRVEYPDSIPFLPAS